MKWISYVIILLIFISCKRDDIKGVVIKKIHEKAYSCLTFVPICNGKTTVFHPMWIYVPDNWTLLVRDSIIHDISVTYETYNTISVGDSLFRIGKDLTYKK